MNYRFYKSTIRNTLWTFSKQNTSLVLYLSRYSLYLYLLVIVVICHDALGGFYRHHEYSCAHTVQYLVYWACGRAWRVDQQNWTPQVESNSIISPAELIPTSQQRHTVNSLRSAPTRYSHSDWLGLAARTATAESLCPCLQSGSFCSHTHWLHLASMNSFNSLFLEEQSR